MNKRSKSGINPYPVALILIRIFNLRSKCHSILNTELKDHPSSSLGQPKWSLSCCKLCFIVFIYLSGKM